MLYKLVYYVLHFGCRRTCRAEDGLSPEKREELFSKHIERLCISTKDTDKYLAYQEKNLKDIHLFGRIARIIDTYDAMTSKRSYAEAKRPFAVLAEMKNKMSGYSDEELLREFICFLGPKDQRKVHRSGDPLYSIPAILKY